MTKDNILKSEVKGRPDWKMADNESIWLSAMFMQKHKIRYPFPESQFNELWQYCSSSVDSVGVWEKYTEFLSELKETIGRVSWSSNE